MDFIDMEYNKKDNKVCTGYILVRFENWLTIW